MTQRSTRAQTAMPSHGILSRLRKDVAGNVMAMTAAAIFPLAGLIGGAVDMSRLYAVKSRLQAACDAGALAGRRVMGTGFWSANSGAANTAALKLFDSNFKPGIYGSTAQTRSFAENNGTVTGTVTATVPMTLMRIFGYDQKVITVACDSEMRIPNTDVMFVLDTTGSMNCGAGDQSSDSSNAATYCVNGNNNGVEKSNAKIKGLRSAVKCFYEALAKLDTGEACPGAAPSGGISSAVQLRFGFVPYSVNVNVGKLLPTSFFADTANYQTRTANFTPTWTYTLGTESGISGYGTWSPTSAPSSFNTSSGYSGFAVIGTTSVTVGGTTYNREVTGKNSTTCPALNDLANSSSTLKAKEDLPGTTYTTLTNTETPNHPDSTQTLTYSQTDPRQMRGYRYRWVSFGGTTSCWLQRGTGTYNRVQSGGTSTRSISWTEIQKFTNWTYQQASVNVSGLKSGSNWNNSFVVPNLTTTSTTVYESGNLSSTNVSLGAPVTVNWDGCVEEAQTFQNTDGNPADDWSPIPSDAKDMNIDLVPSDSTTYWKPMLSTLVWGRYDSSNNNITTARTTTSNLSRNNTYYCPTEAKKLQIWSGASAFEDYVNDLAPIGNTYHDIGMLWGARFMSPTGIFASENATTPTGAAIQRHMVFMTDGDTSTDAENYTAYGVSWWDRRQTASGSAPSATLLNNVVNARLTALCTAVKNKGITLWVVSYGNGVSPTAEARLQACASSNTHYFSAADTTTLINNFRQIAAEISELRLTS